MRKARIFLFLGIWVVILPYLGFPSSWKDVLSTLTGLGLIYVSYILYKDYKKDYKIEENQEKTFDNFSENSDFGKNESVNERGGEPARNASHSDASGEI
jgi:amino acid permease